jgi:hypothetical protein
LRVLRSSIGQNSVTCPKKNRRSRIHTKNGAIDDEVASEAEAFSVGAFELSAIERRRTAGRSTATTIRCAAKNSCWMRAEGSARL